MALSLLTVISFALKVYDQFDVHSCPKFDKLWPLFNRLCCVLATSAPVEDGFSQSGIIMRLHRSKMSDELLETFMFLKWNRRDDWRVQVYKFQTAVLFLCNCQLVMLPCMSQFVFDNNGYLSAFCDKVSLMWYYWYFIHTHGTYNILLIYSFIHVSSNWPTSTTCGSLSWTWSWSWSWSSASLSWSWN